MSEIIERWEKICIEKRDALLESITQSDMDIYTKGLTLLIVKGWYAERGWIE